MWDSMQVQFRYLLLTNDQKKIEQNNKIKVS